MRVALWADGDIVSDGMRLDPSVIIASGLVVARDCNPAAQDGSLAVVTCALPLTLSVEEDMSAGTVEFTEEGCTWTYDLRDLRATYCDDPGADPDDCGAAGVY